MRQLSARVRTHTHTHPTHTHRIIKLVLHADTWTAMLPADQQLKAFTIIQHTAPRLLLRAIGKSLVHTPPLRALQRDAVLDLVSGIPRLSWRGQLMSLATVACMLRADADAPHEVWHAAAAALSDRNLGVHACGLHTLRALLIARRRHGFTAPDGLLARLASEEEVDAELRQQLRLLIAQSGDGGSGLRRFVTRGGMSADVMAVVSAVATHVYPMKVRHVGSNANFALSDEV